MQQVYFTDLGLTDYNQTWQLQEQLMQQAIAIKLHNRQHAAQQNPLHRLLFCEHKHVYTLGKSGSENNLLINEAMLKQYDATFYRINRGGDITYHGPGQCVGYPILDLDLFFNDVHKYMRCLEEVIIRTIADFGITGCRIAGLTGVWLPATATQPERKICAFGVRLSRWVTMHGWALNVNNDLNYFNHIVPCGISDKAVTSLKNELGAEVPMQQVKKSLKQHFMQVFEVTLADADIN
jgi:lipoyl(octanoyl) transferase